MSGRLDSNRRPPEPHSGGNQSQVCSSQAHVNNPATVCTPVCTSTPKPEQDSPLDVLAATLLGLSPEDRARLAALLLGGQPGQAEGNS